MQIYKYSILWIASLILGFVSYNFSYADTNCLGTSQESVSLFLQGCADDPENAISPGLAGSGKMGLAALITKVAQRVIEFGALFAIGAIVFSGIQYTTSYGDDEKVKKAKMTGIYALTGLLLLLVSFPLVSIIVNFIYSLWK